MSPTPPTGVEVSARPGAVVIRLHGDLDLEQAEQLDLRLWALPDHVECIVLDLLDVGFADSTAVRLCARIDAFATRSGRRFEVRAAGAAAEAVRLAGLGAVLGDHEAQPVDAAWVATLLLAEHPDGPDVAEPPDHELFFLGRATAPARARAATSRWLDRVDHGLRLDDVLLVVSELVTNVVLHTDGPGRLGLRVDGHNGDGDRIVVVEVRDGSPSVPVPRHRAGSQGGFGLRLVDRLARRWGCTAGPSGKTIWVEVLDRGPTAPDDREDR